jgi:hypothetical protein
LITLILFVKGTAQSQIENLVAQAQVAAARDTLDRIREIPEVDQMVVATASPEFAAEAARLGARVELDPAGEDFHFGLRLAALVDKYQAAIPLYVGGGSGPLMRVSDWSALVRQVVDHPDTVITNNVYSCDWAAWSPGQALTRIAPPALDNDLAYRLHTQGGLQVISLPKDAATQLDIDTPTDLWTTSLHSGTGTHLRRFLQASFLDLSRVQHVKALVQDSAANLVIAGRVSASMALFLERETRAQWRIFSEERGMRASGRQARGDVHSLLGFYMDLAGPDGLFGALGRLADGVVLDSRVLFAHSGLRPTAADRFHSDLLQPDTIADPRVRAFTAAACSAPVPILLGGHSLVSGGMYALAEK